MVLIVFVDFSPNFVKLDAVLRSSKLHCLKRNADPNVILQGEVIFSIILSGWSIIAWL